MGSSVVILSWLLFANTVRADGEIRQPPTLRDAAQAHFRDGRAFFQTEQFGPAIVEFRAAWELSGERDLLHNLSWACEKAGRIVEAKDYANRYLAQSRGTADEAMAEKRVKFLSSRYPDAEAKPAPSEVAAPHAQPASVAMPAAVGAGSVQSSETPSDGAAPASQAGKRRTLAIGLLASGGAALAVSMGLGAGALGVWSEAASPDTYFDRWQNLNATGQSLSIASGVFGAVGIALLVPGAAVLKAK